MIKVYSKQACPFCIRAKNLLKRKGYEFESIDIQENDIGTSVVRDYWESVGKRSTVPLIVVDGTPIGGYNDLVSYIETTMETL